MHRSDKLISVSDLRYHFPEVERLLKQGTRIDITKHGRVIARMLPVAPGSSVRRPDFLKRLRAVFGDKMLKVSGAELLARERNRY